MGDTSARTVRKVGTSQGSSIDLSDEGGFVAPGENGSPPSNVITHQMHKVVHSGTWVIYNPISE